MTSHNDNSMVKKGKRHTNDPNLMTKMKGTSKEHGPIPNKPSLQ